MQFAQEKHKTPTSGVISDWYASELSKSARPEFQRVVKDLRIIPAVRWSRPDYSILGGGIGEIRFKKDGIQWRPLGFFAAAAFAAEIVKAWGYEPETEVFILVLGASKKQGSKKGRDHDNWSPRDALASAAKWRDIVIQRGRSAVHALEF